MTFLLAAAGCRTPLEAQPPASAPDPLEALVRAYGATQAIWSVSVRDTSGTVLHAFQDSLWMQPASNMKLYTTAAVLDSLGPKFRFSTYLMGTGRQEGTVWQGDLHLPGTYDPTWDGRFHGGDRYRAFADLTTTLRAMGITTVTGALIGYVGSDPAGPYRSGWEVDDTPFYYAPAFGKLNFNGNTVFLTVRADGNVGDTPVISWEPFRTDYVHFVNEQRITAPGTRYREDYRRLPGSNRIHLGSTMPPGYVETEALTVSDPEAYTLDTFVRWADSVGVRIEGGYRIERGDFKPETVPQPLGAYHSPPLDSLVFLINKDSENFYTEMVAEAMGGVDSVEARVLGIGVPERDLSMRDASGLASANRITTRGTTALLVAMLRHAQADTYLRSMTVAGVDGTLRNRMRNTPLRGRFAGKTGTITGVRSLSGYLTTASGRTLVVSIITNHHLMRTAQIDAVHEAMLLHLYRTY